jgi:hypothetical protein
MNSSHRLEYRHFVRVRLTNYQELRFNFCDLEAVFSRIYLVFRSFFNVLVNFYKFPQIALPFFAMNDTSAVSLAIPTKRHFLRKFCRVNN